MEHCTHDATLGERSAQNWQSWAKLGEANTARSTTGTSAL
jgi:hypothetical protein